MAIKPFKAFNSTVTPPGTRRINSNDAWLTDPTTGVIIGAQNQNANGADARFIPVDVTAAQLAAPTAAMIADLDATFRLNVAPYTRYQSNGLTLVEIAAAGSPDGSSYAGSVLQTIPPGSPAQVIGPDSYAVVWAPLTIQSALGLVVQGKLVVISQPA